VFVVLLAVIWLLVSWGRLPSSGILIWYMCIHPMCFQSWVYWCGVQFRVAFSVFIRSVGESRSSSFLGWVFLSFFFFQAFVLLLVASVVDKALFTCGVEWSSNSSVFPACFLQKLLPPSLFGILAIIVHGFYQSSSSETGASNVP